MLTEVMCQFSDCAGDDAHEQQGPACNHKEYTWNVEAVTNGDRLGHVRPCTYLLILAWQYL